MTGDVAALPKDDANLETDSTSLLIDIRLPAMDLHETLVFKVRPARESREEVVQAVTETLQDLVESLQARNLLSAEQGASEERLAALREHAAHGLEGWRTRLRDADEKLHKVEHAQQLMNEMREAYHKEILVLRDELYRKADRERRNEEFEASDITYFDPTRFVLDDDATAIRQRAETLQRLYENCKKQCLQRVNDLRYQLETAKIHTNRKDMLLTSLMQLHSYKNEGDLEKVFAQHKVAVEAMSSAVATPSTPSRRSSPGPMMSKSVTGLVSRATSALGRGGKGDQVEVPCSCGNVLMPDANFCRKCGNGRKDGKALDCSSEKCRCGNIFLPDADFCRRCGVKRPEDIFVSQADAGMKCTSSQQSSVEGTTRRKEGGLATLISEARAEICKRSRSASSTMTRARTGFGRKQSNVEEVFAGACRPTRTGSRTSSRTSSRTRSQCTRDAESQSELVGATVEEALAVLQDMAFPPRTREVASQCGIDAEASCTFTSSIEAQFSTRMGSFTSDSSCTSPPPHASFAGSASSEPKRSASWRNDPGRNAIDDLLSRHGVPLGGPALEAAEVEGVMKRTGTGASAKSKARRLTSLMSTKRIGQVATEPADGLGFGVTPSSPCSPLVPLLPGVVVLGGGTTDPRTPRARGRLSFKTTGNLAHC
mmetsp:Transcript_179852/g.570468  ORF Transcript_179852/g.570468 Transcript_179852/m.570468 type:complete len:656 (+) Transcript_179852:113-2080(+)